MVLKAGANLNKVHADGFKPLHRAIWGNDRTHTETVKVLLEAGDVLYLPSYWFHYIISTGTSAQCNTRSGAAIRGRDIIRECGFY